MIKIGKLTDYAMLVMSLMAKHPDFIMSASCIAELLHLNAPTVSKILKILSDASLVNSVRGADGGYRLARSPFEITVFDIITAMEGDVAMTECCDVAGMCAIDTSCAMRENWRKINAMVQKLLNKFTIIDMMGPLPEHGPLATWLNEGVESGK